MSRTGPSHPSILGHILRFRHRPISRLDVLDPVPQTFQIVCWQVGCIFHHVRCKKMHDTFFHMPAVPQCPSSPNLSAPLFSCGGSAYIQAFWPCFSFQPQTTNHQLPTTAANTCVKHNLPKNVPTSLALSPSWCQPDPFAESAKTHRCNTRAFIARQCEGHFT